MSRPKAKAKRDQQLNFSLTAEELTTLRSRAAASGLHLIDYGRAMLLSQPITIAENPDGHAASLRARYLVYAQLRRLGNNLNQIARHLHAFHEPAPPGLETLLTELRGILHRDDRRDR